METHELIDAQFDRAVEIVQGLPKTGPIQTDYEEKLQMYSLYKQATVGNVKSPRPGIWDMLGRAKWDAWAKHKDIEPYEAKWLYVEALLKVLRRYSDKTIAQTLVQELESYSGDPSNLVLSRASMQSPGSGSSGSNASQEPIYPLQRTPGQYTGDDDESSEGEGSTEGEDEDEARDLRAIGPNSSIQSHLTPHRPLSAQRYQTPITGSLLSQQTAGSGGGGIPATQPLPTYETPSAFPAPSISSTPASTYHPPPGSHYETSRPGAISPLQHMYETRNQTQSLPVIPSSTHHLPIRPASRITLERAIENVQVHLTALTERLEILESRSLHNSSSNSNRNSPYGLISRDISSSISGRPDHNNNRNNKPTTWDLNNLGMWSYVLNPISHIISLIHKLAHFFTRDENRSPTKVIIRRLCLDLSFLVTVIMVIGALWRKSGVRRREVKVALGVLWRAILGTGVVVTGGGHGHGRRSLQDRGV